MNIFEITLPATSHTTLLESVCGDLTRDQRRVVEGIVNQLRPLFEAPLTQTQIDQIFSQAEQNLTGAGVNRSGAGRAVDVTKAVGSAVGSGVSAVNNAINKLGGYLQTTAPVQYFDQKFEDLKQKISAKLGVDSKTMAVIDQLGQYAKANPGKTAFVIGALTAVASFAGGPAGGAVAGQVLRGAVELLKGEKLSTAVGRGAKSAALGAVVGAGAKELGGMLSSTMQSVADQLHPGVDRLMLNWKNTFGKTVADIDVRGLPQDLGPIKTAWDQAKAQYSYGNLNKAVESLLQLDQMVDKISTPEYIAKLSTEIQDRKNWQAGAKAFKTAIDAAVAAAQGAATAKTAPAQPAAPAANAAPANFNQVREHRIRLTNKEVKEIFAVAGNSLNEGPLDWLKTKGKNLTTKVTADKLNKLWIKAGKPTGSDQIAVILKQAEVPDTVISSAFDSVGAPVPSWIGTPAATEPAAPTQSVQPTAAPATKPTAVEPAATSKSTAGIGQKFTKAKQTPISNAPATPDLSSMTPAQLLSKLQKTLSPESFNELATLMLKSKMSGMNKPK